MAVANWSSSAMVKAVLLPFILVVLAMAAGASSTEDGPAVAKSGGRFSETTAGRKLLAFSPPPSTTCDCRALILAKANNPQCCQIGLPILPVYICFDVGRNDILKCGSCTNKCSFGQICCNGVCVDPKTNKNNCGICGNACPGKYNCKFGFCKY